jgi:hypothetical protein
MVVLTANGWYDGGPAYKAPGDWFYVNLSQQVNSGSDPVRVWVDLNRGWNFTSDQPNVKPRTTCGSIRPIDECAAGLSICQRRIGSPAVALHPMPRPRDPYPDRRPMVTWG